jgi:hypothetical protein
MRAGRAIGWMIGFAVVAGPSGASAQLSPFSGIQQADPFSFYYGVYLPRQASLAAQPTVSDTINYRAAERQRYAVTDRSALLDPFAGSPFGLDSFGAGGGFGGGPTQEDRSKQDRRSRIISPTGVTSTHLDGRGPIGYFNSTGAYFPTRREAQGPNSNVAVIGQSRGRRGGGGGGGASMGRGGGMGGFGS